ECGLQARVTAGGLKNKGLLKDLDNTLGKLNAIPNDTAAKLQATKSKAGDANDTANNVLARLRDMNLNPMGLQRNNSKLENDVNKASNMIQDAEEKQLKCLCPPGETVSVHMDQKSRRVATTPSL
uniref:Uncharacterized protein n=1 Tax=Hucho hucho TaxID=62062 RepID=A0A4W5NZZ8_9TELE